MKKIGIYLLYCGALIFAIALVWISVSPDKKTESDNIGTRAQTSSPGTAEEQDVKPAEKVQVYAFHSTKRCYSCVTMGEYTKQTIEEFFQTELRYGKIEFKEVNVDLPENKEVAKKFQAVGSSLFINAIIDGEDNIKEEVQVWRLLGNKTAFSDYLSQEIKKLF